MADNHSAGLIDNMDRQDVRIMTNSSAEVKEKRGLSPRTPSSRSSTPPHRITRDNSKPPKIIVLGLWPGAGRGHVNYYLQGYRSLYPSARVVTIRPGRASKKSITEALHVLVGEVEKAPIQQSQDVLIHLFGDDAAVQVCRLLRAYRLIAERPMGVKAIVLDSVPVIIAPNLRTLRNAPEQLLIFLYSFLLAMFWRLASVLTLRFSDPYNSQVQRDLYDTDLLPSDTRKCYVFPEKNVMFAWDRPTHADEVCERKDFEVKRRRVDEDQRWTGDQERYWLGIENAWEGR